MKLIETIQTMDGRETSQDKKELSEKTALEPVATPTESESKMIAFQLSSLNVPSGGLRVRQNPKLDSSQVGSLQTFSRKYMFDKVCGDWAHVAPEQYEAIKESYGFSPYDPVEEGWCIIRLNGETLLEPFDELSGGGTANNTGGGGMFGVSNPGGFGGGTANNTGGGGMFGSSTSPDPGGSLFGNIPQAGGGGGGLFPQAQPAGGGGGLFNNNIPQQGGGGGGGGGLFPQAQSSGGGGLFGGGTSPNPPGSSFGFGGGQPFGTEQNVREEAFKIYRRYNPSMIHEVEPALKKYAGRELELLRKLHAYYVAPPKQFGQQVHFSPTVLAKSVGRSASR